MKYFTYILVFTLITSSYIFSQEEQIYENPFPKFVPYKSEKNSVLEQSVKIDNKDLGKEQSARFLSIDRFADKYPSFSPYNYAANNPLLFIDMNGDSIQVNHMPLNYSTMSYPVSPKQPTPYCM